MRRIILQEHVKHNNDNEWLVIEMGVSRLLLNLLPVIEAKQFAPLVGSIYVHFKSDTIKICFFQLLHQEIDHHWRLWNHC